MTADETHAASDRVGSSRRSRGLYDWLPSKEDRLSMPAGGNFKTLSATGADDVALRDGVADSKQGQRPRIDLRP